MQHITLFEFIGSNSNEFRMLKSGSVRLDRTLYSSTQENVYDTVTENSCRCTNNSTVHVCI